MKRFTTSQRLRQIMEERNLKQVDILNKVLPYCAKFDVKMNKSDISQYVSGKVEPIQDKLVMLGMALGVTEAWLMGFDVPFERKDSAAKAEQDFDFYYKYSLLDQRDKEVVMDMLESMLGRKNNEV